MTETNKARREIWILMSSTVKIVINAFESDIDKSKVTSEK